MRKPKEVLEAEGVLENLRAKAAAKPNDTDLQMALRMAERTLEIVKRNNEWRPMVTPEAIEAAKETTDIIEQDGATERAYPGGASS